MSPVGITSLRELLAFLHQYSASRVRKKKKEERKYEKAYVLDNVPPSKKKKKRKKATVFFYNKTHQPGSCQCLTSADQTLNKVVSRSKN